MSIKKVQAENLENYVIKATADGFDYTLDYAKRNPGNQSVGTSPTGLLLSSLAGCQLITARSFFDRHKIDSSILELEITGDFNYGENGWTLKADAVLSTNATLDSQQIDDLMKFIDRYCTVSGVLESGNTINLSIEQVNS